MKWSIVVFCDLNFNHVSVDFMHWIVVFFAFIDMVFVLLYIYWLCENVMYLVLVKSRLALVQ